jgi:hypothetical protein
MTFSPTFQSTGVATGNLAVSWSESSKRRISLNKRIEIKKHHLKKSKLEISSTCCWIQ